MAEYYYRMLPVDFQRLRDFMRNRGISVEPPDYPAGTIIPRGAPSFIARDGEGRVLFMAHHRARRSPYSYEVVIDDSIRGRNRAGFEAVVQALEGQRGRGALGLHARDRRGRRVERLEDRRVSILGSVPSLRMRPRTPEERRFPSTFVQLERRTYALNRQQYRRLQGILRNLEPPIMLDDFETGATMHGPRDDQWVGEVGGDYDSRGRALLTITNQYNQQVYERALHAMEGTMRLRRIPSERREPEIGRLRDGQTRVSMSGREFRDLRFALERGGHEVRFEEYLQNETIERYRVLDREGNEVGEGYFFNDRTDDSGRNTFIMTYNDAQVDRTVRRIEGITDDRFEVGPPTGRVAPAEGRMLTTAETRQLLWNLQRDRRFELDYQAGGRVAILDRRGRELGNVNVLYDEFRLAHGDHVPVGGELITSSRLIQNITTRAVASVEQRERRPRARA